MKKSEEPVKNFIFLFAILAAMTACRGKQDMTAQSAQAAPAAVQAAQNPAPPAPAVKGRLTGTVLETQDAGGYTYLRLSTPGGERWAAVTQTPIAKGQVASVDVQMTMQNFESKTLNRTFEDVAFGTMAGATGAEPAPVPMVAAMATMPAHADGAAQHMAVPAAGDVNVARASGPDAKTIGELWSARASLAGRSVTVRGKVVKFLGGIMGKNFVHLRDGSKADGQDADLTVTTDAVVAVGDVVVVRGNVSVDRDFGAGYKYPVIIENAEVAR
ncbi:MAG: nucleotide-binding protein [Acidobacteriota bacterium]